jgi:hypothetical protein
LSKKNERNFVAADSQRLEDIEGIGEVPDFPGDPPQVLEDFALGVQDLDALRVRVVAGREVLPDRGGELAKKFQIVFVFIKIKSPDLKLL